MEFMLSAILLFVCLTSAVSLIIVSGLLVGGAENKIKPIIYIVVAAAYAYILISALIKQSSGIACSSPTPSQLIMYTALMLLHLFFIYDSLPKRRSK